MMRRISIEGPTDEGKEVTPIFRNVEYEQLTGSEESFLRQGMFDDQPEWLKNNWSAGKRATAARNYLNSATYTRPRLEFWSKVVEPNTKEAYDLEIELGRMGGSPRRPMKVI